MSTYACGGFDECLMHHPLLCTQLSAAHSKVTFCVNDKIHHVMQETAVTHLVWATPVLNAGGAEGEGQHLHPLGAAVCAHTATDLSSGRRRS